MTVTQYDPEPLARGLLTEQKGLMLGTECVKIGEGILDEHEDVLRTCSSGRVIANFGRVFAHRVASVASTHSEPSKTELDHSESDTVYYASAINTLIEVFLSHNWSASRFFKWLALLHYLNATAATMAATLAWVLMVIFILSQRGFDPSACWDFPYMHHLLVWFPIAVFFVIYLFGQELTGHRFGKAMWLDKLCIHQTRDDIKLLGVKALDEFVAKSERLLILWDEQYFERLWCILELAVFAHVKQGADQIIFQPLWLSPWLLTTIALDLLSNIFFVKLIWLATDPFHLGPDLNLIVGVGLNLFLAYLPIVVPTVISFRQRVASHMCLVEQLGTFSAKDAQCSFESDRSVVEAKVKQFYGDLEQFDYFVRTELKDAIEQNIGAITRMPYGTCVLAFLPLEFSSVVEVLGCYGEACAASAKMQHYPSLHAYMASQTMAWLTVIFMVFPVTYPLALWLVHGCMRKIQNKVLQMIACFLSGIVAYFYMGLMGGLVVYFDYNAFAVGGIKDWVAWISFYSFLFMALWHSFR